MTKKRNKNFIKIEQCFFGALVDLLFDKGYKDISVNDIIERSGVKSKKTFYLHFKDKEEMFLKAQEKLVNDVFEHYKNNSSPASYFTNRTKFYKLLSNTVKKNLAFVTCVSNTPFAIDFVKSISDKISAYYKMIYTTGDWKDCNAPVEIFRFYHCVVSGIVFEYMAEVKDGKSLDFAKVEASAASYRKMVDSYCLEYFSKLIKSNKKLILPDTYVDYMISIYPDSKDIWQGHILQTKKK